MGMTNDIDKIREITGYEPGKAFIYGFNEDGRVRRECVETYGVDTPGEPVVYDTRTKNFHIFPNSMEITDEILQSEADLRLKVYNYFIEIIYIFLTIFLYLLKCPQSLILSALRAFCFCGKPHISRSIFLYFRYQAWLKSW